MNKSKPIIDGLAVLIKKELKTFSFDMLAVMTIAEDKSIQYKVEVKYNVSLSAKSVKQVMLIISKRSSITKCRL